MPIFAGVLGVFCLSSLAFPGTNSFIGEFLVMAGGFSWANELAQSWAVKVMILVVPGVVLAAAYNLRMLQRVAYGGTRNPDHSALKDLGAREILTLAPLLVLVFWIGLNPRPFTRVLRASVENLVAQVQGIGVGVAPKNSSAVLVTAETRNSNPETRNKSE
jgi:NADH-quinone oxidoreductase subunit M